MTRIDGQGAMEAGVATVVVAPLERGVSEMPSIPKRSWTWRALPSALRQRVTSRGSLLWLIATAALFVTCLTSFLVWVAEDRSVTLTPISGNHEGAPSGDPVEEPPAEEPPVEEEPLEEAPAEEAPAEEAATEESAPTSPSVLPIVVSGVSGIGGLLSGVAAMITVRQAADKRGTQQAPGSTHSRRLPEQQQFNRACGRRRGY
ncbi:hypothetical protein ACIBAG_35735 [Streptomyces sp. NPDC051243]|uniref:hypothetical protein n=1 Tax=Streptomyces sp. NPDC051243 TaxID=3365646 RepID=UPI00378F4262